MILPTQMSIGKALGQEVPNCSKDGCKNKGEYSVCLDHILWVDKLENIKNEVKKLIEAKSPERKKHCYRQLEDLIIDIEGK